MNNRTMFALLAVLTAVGTLSMSTAYAAEDRNLPPACVGCSQEEAKASASKMLKQELPVSVWTDKTDYKNGDMIKVEGQVANVASGYPITITVVSPQNAIVTIAQVSVATDGTFGTTLNTAGPMWKYDGTYTIKANYGSPEKSNKAKVELTGGVAWKANYQTPTPSKQCSSTEISASGQCIPYTISGAKVTSASINTDDNSIIINIDSKKSGTLIVTPPTSVQKGIFMVLVDGEEWDDVEIVGNKVTVKFLAGAEQIEIIGTFVVPEFGTIAAMILAVAIISIIAISAKSRLSIIPRY